jgi:hypothetical protein
LAASSSSNSSSNILLDIPNRAELRLPRGTLDFEQHCGEQGDATIASVKELQSYCAKSCT